MTTQTTRKATHTGHCQVCGARQKLPGGVLAKHGYTTRWGFFSGVCNGAGALPFEQDKSLIEDAITRALHRAESLRAEAARLRAEADPAAVWYHAYFSGTSRLDTGYRWIQTRLGFPEGAARSYYWHPGDRQPAGWRSGHFLGFGRDQAPADRLAAAARYYNGLRAQELEREAGQVDEYVAWQRGRIAGWAPAPLTPIG